MQITLPLVSFFEFEETETQKSFRTTNIENWEWELYLNVINGSLQNSGLTQFITTYRILLLTCWDKILQRTIAFFNGIPSFLFSLRVSLSSAFLVAFRALTITILIILTKKIE